MANCAMMNVPPPEARRLTLFDYQALLHNWQAAHATGDEPPEPPSIEETEARRDRLERRGVKVLH
jgi:hypothetical protein